MSRYARYLDLKNVPSEYAKRMNRLSNRIFGEVVRNTNSKSMRVVKLFTEQPMNLNRNIYAYYPRLPETDKLMKSLRNYGLFRDEHADFNEEMERMRTLRGKAKKPYKGWIKKEESK